MVKIKQKKTLNLPQLIEYAWENDVTNTWYRASNVEEYISEVFFDATGLPQFSNTFNKNDTFTVEVEEEITEDTFLDNLVEFADFGCGEKSFFVKGSTIKESDNFSSKAFYILNDDLTMTLIWRDGKLI